MTTQEEETHQIEELAGYGALHNIRGSSLTRSSLLKPFDIILRELESSPNPDAPGERRLLRIGTAGLIFEHIERIAPANHKPKQRKRKKVEAYVDLFFDTVLAQAFGNEANSLLEREKMVRAAYLLSYRQALARIFIAKGQAKDEADAEQQIDKLEESEEELDEENLSEENASEEG